MSVHGPGDRNDGDGAGGVSAGGKANARFPGVGLSVAESELARARSLDVVAATGSVGNRITGTPDE